MELPSYPAALDLLHGAGLRLRSIPTTHAGWDLEVLSHIAREQRPQIAYLIPDFQNPTGALIDSESRRDALGILGRADTFVVVDETFAEVGLDRVSAVPPLASYTGARTITVGSLNKAVWGGLRIGWARAEAAVIQRLAGARSTVDLASPIPAQLMALAVFERLDEIIEHRRELLRQRRLALAEALSGHLPDWRFELPLGGQFIWAELPEPISTGLAVSAAGRGLHLTPGPRFGSAGLLERYLRLPFTLPPAQLEQAARTLASLTPTGEHARPDPRATYVA